MRGVGGGGAPGGPETTGVVGGGSTGGPGRLPVGAIPPGGAISLSLTSLPDSSSDSSSSSDGETLLAAAAVIISNNIELH